MKHSRLTTRTVQRRAAAIGLALLLLMPAAFGKEKSGAHVQLVRQDGAVVEGELLTVKGRELILRTFSTSEGVTEVIDGLAEVRIVRKAKVLRGMGKGFMFGAGAGAGIGALLGSGGRRQSDWLDIGPRNAGEGALTGGVIFGVLGIMAGGIAGAFGGADTVYRIRGASEGAINGVLSALNRSSRRPS